jgi:sec-independent protein translocase protein TatC
MANDQQEVIKKKPSGNNHPAHLPDEMSFLDHLEELRWRIIKGCIGIVVGIVIAYIFSDFLINQVLFGPTKSSFFMYHLFGIHAHTLSFQSRRLQGQFFTYWGMLFVIGAIIGAPFFIYELWAFIVPAIERSTKLKTLLHTLFITFFFVLGVCFCYLILIPLALHFFSSFQISSNIKNLFDINAYFSTVAMWIFSCGVVFELPVFSYYLSKFGIITPALLKKYWKYAVVLAFILAAFLTPPDPVSQIIVAIPLILLYILAIYVSKVAVRKREKEKAKAMGRS